MSTAHELFAQIERAGASEFDRTSLAAGHHAVTRSVRRHRTARAAATAVTGVGVVGAGTWGATSLVRSNEPVNPLASVSGMSPSTIQFANTCEDAAAAIADPAADAYPSNALPGEILCELSAGPDRVIVLRGDAGVALQGVLEEWEARGYAMPCLAIGYSGEGADIDDGSGGRGVRPLVDDETHGTGLAVDLCVTDDVDHARFAEVAAPFGWVQATDASWWHFEYSPTAAPGPTVDVLTVVPGQTSADIAARLAEAYGVTGDQAAAALAQSVDELVPGATSVEGWALDSAFDVSRAPTVEQAADALVGARVQQLTDLGVARDQWQTVITKASMVEREAPLAVDKPKVARVIDNRLALDMKLELDSTVKFVAPGDGVFTTDADRATESPYNTYKYLGLPPGAIATPSLESIQAVLAPAEGDWLFFVTVNLETGELAYASTFPEHQANVQLLQEWINANR